MMAGFSTDSHRRQHMLALRAFALALLIAAPALADSGALEHEALTLLAAYQLLQSLRDVLNTV